MYDVSHISVIVGKLNFSFSDDSFSFNNSALLYSLIIKPPSLLSYNKEKRHIVLSLILFNLYTSDISQPQAPAQVFHMQLHQHTQAPKHAYDPT